MVYERSPSPPTPVRWRVRLRSCLCLGRSGGDDVHYMIGEGAERIVVARVDWTDRGGAQVTDSDDVNVQRLASRRRVSGQARAAPAALAR
jgi:hypothetical protein